MKNIIKFILRMAVAAGIVVGVVALVMYFTNKGSEITAIADTSANFNLSVKLDNSHKGLVTIVEQNNQNSFDNKASQDVITAVVAVNDVLEDYYNYYITLTCYENASNGELKNDILQSLNTLNEKTDLSIKYLAQVNSASNANYTEKNARIVNLFNALCNQTEALFNTCDLLKQYVYQVNYQTDVCTSKPEAVLEMAKDYAKVVFDSDIKGNVYAQNSVELITDATTTGFLSIAQKTLNMGAEDGSLTEINFVYNYNKINREFLTEYYSANALEKAAYVLNIDNFMGTAPEDETAEQLSARTTAAQEQQKFMSYLATYMVTSF